MVIKKQGGKRIPQTELERRFTEDQQELQLQSYRMAEEELLRAKESRLQSQERRLRSQKKRLQTQEIQRSYEELQANLQAQEHHRITEEALLQSQKKTIFKRWKNNTQ